MSAISSVRVPVAVNAARAAAPAKAPVKPTAPAPKPTSRPPNTRSSQWRTTSSRSRSGPADKHSATDRRAFQFRPAVSAGRPGSGLGHLRELGGMYHRTQMFAADAAPAGASRPLKQSFPYPGLAAVGGPRHQRVMTP